MLPDRAAQLVLMVLRGQLEPARLVRQVPMVRPELLVHKEIRGQLEQELLVPPARQV